MEDGTSDTSRPVALIVGVTGMVGLSLAEALKKPTPLSSSVGKFPWKVYGVARQPLPSWFPSSLLDQFISVDVLDQTQTIQKLTPISSQVTHVFWVALQLRETEDANVTLNSIMLANVLDVLISASPSRLRHITLQTGTKHYLGPIFDPQLADQLVHHEPPFEEHMPRLPYPNFYYDLEDLVASYSPSITYSAHRSSIIIGASSRSFHNSLLTLSVYATISKQKGLPFRFSGSKYTWEHFCDMTDARVLAEQHVWAAVTDTAKNQPFNCTNGDVFTWKRLWKVLCEVFGVEFVDFDDNERFDWVEMMKDKGKVWDEIVKNYELFKTKMEDITCFDAVNKVLHFKLQHVCSTNKSRELGFLGFADTPKSIRMWVGRFERLENYSLNMVCFFTSVLRIV